MTNKGKVISVDIFFILMLVLQFPLFIALGALSENLGWELSSVALVVITEVYFLVCALIYLLVTKQNFLKIARVRRFHLGSAFLVLLLLITSAPVTTWFNFLSQLFASNIAAETVYDISLSVPMLVAVLALGLLPGIAEEVIFRGVILPIHSLRSIKAGILISALAFSFMHMNLNQMAYTFVLGLLFAVTVEATNSILSSVLMHAVFNAFNTMIVYAVPALMKAIENLTEAVETESVTIEEAISQGAEQTQLLIMLAILTPFALGGLVLTVLLLYAIAKLNKRENVLKSLVSKKYAEHDLVDKSVALFNPFLLISLAICLLVALANLLS